MLSIKDLKNPNYFRTWMTRIIYNCANEMFRKAEKEIGSLDAEIRDRAEENGGASREEIIDLHNAVESLEEPYRTIIKQKYFEDKKISEIAAYTGRAEGTVKSDQTHVACGHNQKQAEQAAKQYAEKKREQMSEDFVLCFFCVFIRTRICFI